MGTELNKWSNCPINLSSREIENPFIVIDDFFSADDLNGHAGALKKWRSRVIGAGYYTDLKGSPSGLVMCRQLNIRLIECAAVLIKSLRIEQLNHSFELDDFENKQEVSFIKSKLNDT